MSSFDTKTLYNFEKYLMLQKSGEVNMVSSEVQARLGISKEEHRYIIDNYSALLDEYNKLKVVDELIDDAKMRVGDNTKGEKEMGFKEAEQAEMEPQE